MDKEWISGGIMLSNAKTIDGYFEHEQIQEIIRETEAGCLNGWVCLGYGKTALCHQSDLWLDKSEIAAIVVDLS